MVAITGELTREVFGDHSPTSRAIFYLLALASLLVFGWGVYRRARLWRLGRQVPNRPGSGGSLIHWVHSVFLQRRLRGRPWADFAHLLLFSGFMVLLLGTTLLAVEHGLAVLLGREAGDAVFHKGLYFAIYELVTDAFGLVLIAGCLLFAVRRWRRPASLAHDGKDWCILAALLVLSITGYGVEGLRIIREQTAQPGFSFVGWLVARMLEAAGITPAAAALPHFVLWWLHAVLALVFVAAFPYTRLLHVLAGALRLTVGPAPLGVLTKLDVEEVERTGVIGVGEIRQFTRGQLLELDACVSCGRCEEACPAFEAGKPLSPRNVVQDLRHYLNAVGPALRASQKREDGGERRVEADSSLLSPPSSVPKLHGGIIAAETLWACTTCSACTDVCPLGVNPLGFITDMRRHLIGEAQLRGAPAAALQKTDRSGNPWGLPPQDRLAWAAGLDVPTPTTCPDFEVLYWVGCAAAYDRGSQKTARSVVQLLTAAGVKFAVLGREERCTGEWARRMGDEFLFQQLAAANVETLKRHGVKRGAKPVVAHCPHCVNSLKQDYPQMDGDYDVLHHTELLARLSTEGRLPLDLARLAKLTGKVAYHDPCYLARVGGVTEPPRRLLALTLIPGGERQLVEMARQRRQTACCGAGGGRMWFDDAPPARVGQSRVQEALATGAGTLAVSCPFCRLMLTDGIAARDSRVQVRDIAELLAEALPSRHEG
jgi:Fe-S oxidoreductase/nitrate reductase gamma subunit